MTHVAPDPPETSGPIIPGEAGPRAMRALGRTLARELPLALRGAYSVRGRPGLALAVVILATIAFFSNVFAAGVQIRRLYPGDYWRLDDRVYRRDLDDYREPLAERWLHTYADDKTYPLVFKPLQAFAGPLGPADGVADGWLRLLSLPLPARAPHTVWRQAASRGLYWLIEILVVAAHRLVFVALVGWILHPASMITAADLRRFWRAHYWPVFAIGLLGFAAWAPLWTLYVSVWPRVANMSLADPISHAVFAAVRVALMLAPFVAMSRGVGARKAIAEGVRLLRRRWFALVTLFVLFRFAYEALVFWRALSPWPIYRAYPYLALSAPAAVLWVWPSEVALALVGLWLAYAFVEIAKREEAAV